MGDWRTGRGPQGYSSATWNFGGFPRARAHGAGSGPGDRPGHCISMLSGSSLGEGAPGLVSQTAGWNDSIRGKSAEEISGYLSGEFRDGRLAGALGGTQE